MNSAQRRRLIVMSRRRFLYTTGLAAAVAACGPINNPQTPEEEAGGGAAASPGASPGAGPAAAPEEVFSEPTTALSGDLSILLWSHFVPQHDAWFDPFVKEWGEQVGVNATVDHINTAEVPARIASEIAAGSGHDLIQHIAPLSQYEPSVVDMTDVVEEAQRRFGEQVDLCRRSSFNPTTEKFYAYSPAWVPDPGDYRRSLWEQAGMPNGPETWDDLLEGGAEIMSSSDVQLGIGLSQEIDSNMAARALMWSFGASIQDENENVVINSDQTIAAVEFMKELFERAMTPEVFAWNAASNNQGLVSGELSYILNSISGYRTAQASNPDVADDTFFVPALRGPETALAATHVMYNWIVPDYSPNVDAAKEFLLHYTANAARVCYESQLYDYPAFPDVVPDLDSWVESDPFGSQPPDKLSILKLNDALEWSTNMGHPGPANPAEGEVFGTFVIPNMMARVARGDQSPADSVAQAESEIVPIFENWRRDGLIGGGSA
jgi:ABC-type glycerol-3-phosphate transport system substrate-binding protein